MSNKTGIVEQTLYEIESPDNRRRLTSQKSTSKRKPRLIQDTTVTPHTLSMINDFLLVTPTFPKFDNHA